MGRSPSIDKAIANLIKWAQRPEWAERYDATTGAVIEAACERHGMTPDQLRQTLEKAGYGGMLFGMLFEDFLSRRWPDGRSLVDDYLARRGWREDPPGRRYLRLLGDSTLSLYEVVAVTPGQHCDLAPLVGEGAPVRVMEHLGTRNLVRWDRLAVRVLKEADGYRFSGAILPLSPGLVRELLELVTRVKKQARGHLEGAFGRGAAGAIPEEEMGCLMGEALAPHVIRLWLEDTLARLRAPPPRLINRDGEEVLFCETRFPVRDRNSEAIVALLDEAEDWVRAEGDTPFWNWAYPEGALPTPAPKGPGIRLDSQIAGGRHTRGTLELRARALVLETNSPARAEEAQRALADLLGAHIGAPLTSQTTVEQARAKRARRPLDPEQETAGMDPALAARLERQFLDEHYRKILDEPIPALGDRSPRECAKTNQGRTALIEWLKQLENNELRRAAQNGKPPYDAAWIWQELGVSPQR